MGYKATENKTKVTRQNRTNNIPLKVICYNDDDDEDDGVFATPAATAEPRLTNLVFQTHLGPSFSPWLNPLRLFPFVPFLRSGSG